MLLHDAFEETSRRLGEKTALVCGPLRSSYADLARQVRATGALLQSHGVTKGDRVVLFLDSSLEFAAAVHAVLRIGAAFVPVSPLVKPDKLAYVLRDTGAVALVAHARMRHVWEPAIALAVNRPVCVVVGGAAGEREVAWEAAAESASTTPPAVDPEDLAAIIYTSGSTGLPKGVMLTHHNMCAAWASVQSYLQLRESDIIGLALPPSFSYGLYYLLMGLGIGATVVLERAAAFPTSVVDGLIRERVTVFPGVPTLFAAILALPGLASYDLSALRLLTNAADALPVTQVRALRAWLPQAELLLMYGMTECKRISYLPSAELERRPDSVGRGIPGQDHWWIDGSGARLGNGATGELVVSGPHVMRGYWNKPDETAARLRPGPGPDGVVLHTGDIFRTDDEGWLYFVARKDDILKTRGEKVAPREVENAIHELAPVLECAVVGVPDQAHGVTIRALVRLKPGASLTEREVIRHCLSRLESFMVPASVVFVSELPRTDSGKIRRKDLR